MSVSQNRSFVSMTCLPRSMVTTLSPLAGGLAAGTVDDSTTNVIAGAQAGQNAVENNNFNLSAIAPKGLQDVGASMTSLY
ncbi:VENN motif pre-toxin domain-containing protein, partial [Samsonia erythrinae]